MDKIKSFVSKYPIIDFLIIAVMIVVFCFLCCNHLTLFLADKGREFLFPEAILNGNVPYKDITLIYFPTAYYINAFIYKVLGVSINSLVISQGILSIAFMFLNYACARFFLDRKESLLLSILIISCCIFSYSDLFAFISPYSYARSYGIATFTLCTFLLIKLFRSDNVKYLYLAALVSGLCFIFKFEFFIAYILLGVALFLYKRLKVVQYLNVILLSTVFPIALLVFLYIQGVTIADITSATAFGFEFSKTAAMTQFLSESGMYPMTLFTRSQEILRYELYFVLLVLLCFAVLKLSSKFKIPWIIPCAIVVMWKFFYMKYMVMQYWLLLPSLIFVVLCFKFKELFKENKVLLVFVIASLLAAQRCFFLLSLSSYGIYSFPLLIICLYIIIKQYFPSELFGVKTVNVANYIIITIIGLYLINLQVKRDDTQFPIETKKGTIYTDMYDYDVMDGILAYINHKIDKNASVLVLPEGHIINFLTDRKTSLKCHMMDRLYHDAFGEAKAMDMISSANADYIILIEGVKLNDFYFPYLYGKFATLSGRYIADNYVSVKEFTNNFGKINILKKSPDR